MKTFSKVIVGSVFFALLFLVVKTSSADKKLLIRVGEEEGRHGVCKKVVMTPKRGEEAVYTSEPGGGQVEKVLPFAFFWQLKEDDGSIPSGDYYRIGSAVGEPYGYVHKESAEEWNTLNCLDPYPPSSNEAFRANLPDGGYIEYVATTTNESARCFILSSDVEDKGIEAEDVPYEVLLYMGETRGADQTTSEVADAREFDITDTPLEVVFVIDTTASMEPLIEVAKEVARLTTEKLQNRSSEIENANVKLGLVQYRDAKGQDGIHCDFDAKLGCRLTKNYIEFTTALGKLRAAPMMSGDFEEAVGFGLEMAMDEQQVGWAPFGSKQIVLLGDAPNKQDHGPSTSAIIEQCKAHGTAGGENTLKDVQIHAIVNGTDTPAILEFQKFATDTGGSSAAFYEHITATNISDPSVDKAAVELAEYLNTAFKSSSAISAGDVKKVQKIARDNPNHAIAQDFYSIMTSNGDPANTEQLFQKGTASPIGVKGANVAEKKILVLKNTLKRLGVNLSAIAMNLEDTDPADRKDAHYILESVQSVLARQLTGDPETLRGTALRDIIDSDLPIQTKSLQYSAETLANMTNEDFQKWIDDIKQAGKIATTRVEETKWLTNGVDIGKKDSSSYAFLAINQLP